MFNQRARSCLQMTGGVLAGKSNIQIEVKQQDSAKTIDEKKDINLQFGKKKKWIN